jgi:hypothetical protein
VSIVFRLGAVCLAALHLIRIFWPAEPGWIMAVVSAAVLLPGLFLMGSGFRKATIVFLILGIGILAFSRSPLDAWVTSWNSMTNTIAIMVAMQVFTIPVAMGRYDEAIHRWADTRLKSERSLFLFSTIITHILTSFLMLGAIPMSNALMGRTLKSRVSHYERFLAVTVSRGYVLAALWAPGAINLFLVVQSTGVAWSSILLPGIVMALLGLGLSYIMELGRHGVLGKSFDEKEAVPAVSKFDAACTSPETTSSPVRANAMAHVLLAAASIVVFVLVLERFGIGAGYTRIMLAGLMVAAIWILLLKDGKAFLAAGKGYWFEGIMKVRDLGPFFVAMGIFSGALEASGLISLARPVLQGVASWLGISSVAILPLIIIALSLIGLHPFITIVLFGKILSNAGIPLPPLTIALGLAVGGAASYMVSPFAGTIMSIASFIDVKASEVAIKWNWRFSLAFFVFGVAFSLLWGAVFAS